jgi:hypothetical protein
MRHFMRGARVWRTCVDGHMHVRSRVGSIQHDLQQMFHLRTANIMQYSCNIVQGYLGTFCPSIPSVVRDAGLAFICNVMRRGCGEAG